jgi:hypothetical protein
MLLSGGQLTKFCPKTFGPKLSFVKSAPAYQVPRDSVRRDDVDGAADGAVAAVRREDDYRGDPGLERAV